MDVNSHVVPALESDAANKVDNALREILDRQNVSFPNSGGDVGCQKSRNCLRRKAFRWWAREVSNL